MDGASRFTQRDAVASILITAINIIAGFLIGVLQHGMDFRNALETYTVLTIGDGLVTVIPALMISISGGLIVTRASSDARLGAEFQKQIFGNSQPLLLAAGVLMALAAFPGMPKIPFLLLGGGAGAAGWQMRKTELATMAPAGGGYGQAGAGEGQRGSAAAGGAAGDRSGTGLGGLVEGAQDSPLLRRISAIRRQLATDLGYLLPPVRVTDNLSLRSREYVISLKGVEIARYELPQGCELAIRHGPAERSRSKARQRASRRSACPRCGSRRTQADRARQSGLHGGGQRQRARHAPLRGDPPLRARAVLTPGRQATAGSRGAWRIPRSSRTWCPNCFRLPTVQRVLQNLLRERVSIRDAVSILEALGEAGGIHAQSGAADRVCAPVDPPGGGEAVPEPRRASCRLGFWTRQSNRRWNPPWSTASRTATSQLAPQHIREILNRISARIQSPETPVVAITSSGARYFLRQMVEPTLPNLFFLAHNEIPPGVRVQSLGNIQ